MSDQPTEAPNIHQVWQYDGSWTRIPNPIPMTDGDDYDALMSRAGFDKGDSWGWSTPSVEVYEHRNEQRWVVDFTAAGSAIHSIHLSDLPSLIDLLSKLAPIATASISSLVVESLESLIFNAGEDAERERKRRARRP